MKLLAPKRNVIVRIDLDNKEKYKFKSGIELSVVKGFDFNKRLDSPSFATVIDGEGIPEGAECLIHHNSSHESYKVQDLSMEEYDIYSVPTDMVYCWRNEENKNWNALKDFLITYRIFEEYKGVLVGIEPKQVPQRLYVVNGKKDNYDVEGKAVFVSKFSDYQIIYHDNGYPASVIRTREREVFGIDYDITEKILNGELLIGNDLESAKKNKTCQYQTKLQHSNQLALIQCAATIS